MRTIYGTAGSLGNRKSEQEDENGASPENVSGVLSRVSRVSEVDASGESARFAAMSNNSQRFRFVFGWAYYFSPPNLGVGLF
jgi:hypothetical protein